MRKTTPVQDFIELAAGPSLSYCDPATKDRFHRLGRRVLKDIAAKLDLAPGSFEIRSNKGGIAVSGEITLHADNIYIQFSQSPFSSNMDFFYRSCKGRKDYCGGRNRWMKWGQLINLDKACEAFRDVMAVCV